MSSLQGDCQAKCNRIVDNIKRVSDRLTRVHNVSTFYFFYSSLAAAHTSDWLGQRVCEADSFGYWTSSVPFRSRGLIRYTNLDNFGAKFYSIKFAVLYCSADERGSFARRHDAGGGTEMDHSAVPNWLGNERAIPRFVMLQFVGHRSGAGTEICGNGRFQSLLCRYSCYQKTSGKLQYSRTISTF